MSLRAPWATMQWQIAWRHLRGSSGGAGRGSTVILWIAGILLAVGLGFAAYAHLLGDGPEPLSGIDAIVVGVDLKARAQWFGLLGAGTAALGGLLFLFGLFGRYFSLLSSIIIMSVLLGCMQLVVVLSLMSGMEQDLRDKILGQKAHVRVSSQDGRSFGDYKPLVQALEKLEPVLGAQAYLRGEVLAVSGRFQRSAVLLGVSTQDLRRVSNLDKTMEAGSLDAIDNPELARKVRNPSSSVSDPPWRLKHLQPKRKPAPAIEPAPSKAVQPSPPVPGTPPARGAPSVPGRGMAPLPDKGTGAPAVRGKGITPVPGKAVRTVPGKTAPGGAAAWRRPAQAGKPSAQAQPVAVQLGQDIRAGVRPQTPPVGIVVPDFGEDEDEDWEDPTQELDLPDAPKATDDGPQTPSVPQGPGDAAPDLVEPLLDVIVIGRELAKEMGGATVGSRLSLITPEGRLTPMGRVPGRKDVRVGGVFYTGLFQYDSSHAYGKLSDVQAFLRQGDRISGIEIKIHDNAKLAKVRASIESLIKAQGRDQELKVETWEELNRSLFAAMLLEKIAMSVQLMCVIIVACFGILASNLMSVLEKSREIAILKAMGASDRQVFGVFVGEGLWVGVIGAVAGVGVGLLLCALLDRYGIPFNGDMLYMDKLPVVVDAGELIAVGIAALVIVWISSLYPAYVASKVRPVDGMRKSDT